MVLEKVDSPEDVKKLSEPELAVLANDLRKKILETVSATGGHVAPNLGAVELTVALHRCFDSPRDRVVWDVGHQAYAHKLLTGRKDRFHTIRQYKGLSGYPNPSESEHDFFAVGHASTSLSASLGMAVARDKRGEHYHVIAVIGDGSLTGGMALEGLNQIGFMQKDVIVVLNDNQMSISPNVGAMGAYTNRLINKIVSTPLFHEVRSDIHLLLNNMPPERQDLFDAVKRLRKNALIVATEGIVFQELGFTYVGPIDGHDFKALIPALEKAKTIKGPVLVHVNTIKGKGYKYAEQKPTSFHGAGPFDLATGKSKKKSDLPSYSKVFSQAVIELAETDDRIMAITAAMPDGTGLTVFRDRFPDRFFDVGIAEQHAITFAAGLASNGLRPVAAIYSTFLQRAFDQLVHDVCMQNLPVVVGVDRAGVVGDDGPTHHGCFDVSYLRLMPNMVVMAPKDGNELRDMVKTGLELKGPCAIRYPRATVSAQPSPEMRSLKPGKAEVLREGGDLAIIALGSMVMPSLEAAEKLAGKGIECTVVNARFAKPLDEELIKKKCRETGRVVVVEENCVRGGLGAGVLKMLALSRVDVKAGVLGIPDCFVEQGGISQLKKDLGLDVEGITAAVESLAK